MNYNWYGIQRNHSALLIHPAYEFEKMVVPNIHEKISVWICCYVL